MKAYNKNTILSIAGNKIDLKRSDFNKEEILKYAEQQNASHYFTSAKTGEGLDEIFEQTTKEIMKSFSLSKEAKPQNKKIVIAKSSGKDSNKKSDCC